MVSGELWLMGADLGRCGRKGRLGFRILGFRVEDFRILGFRV